MSRLSAMSKKTTARSLSARRTARGGAATTMAVARTRPDGRLLTLAAGLALLCLALLGTAAEASPGHRGHGHRYYPRSTFYLSFGFPYYHSYYGYPFYYGDYYAYGPRYAGYWSPDMGAIDLAIKPKKALVYLDGQQIGQVKSYDGWPRYLWLDKGTHELVFYLEGYRTHAETVRVQPGIIMKLKYQLTEGEATPPEQIFAPRPTAEQEAPAATPRRGAASPGTESWRERETVERDVRTMPGQLRIRVEPSDAVVYLDGRLIGSGEELERLHAPLVVDPGAHVLEVARPGYRSQRLDVEATSGEEVWLEVDLEPTGR